MGAPSEYYVDPTSGNDTTGTGAIGTPWASVQKALDTITRDGTNGDRINIKEGASADTLTAALSIATYGTPTAAGPLIFQGYASTAGDGGIGEIDGNATYSIFNEALNGDYCHFVDLKIGNCGSAQILVMDLWCSLIRCEVYGSSNATAVQFDTYTNCIGNHFHTYTGTSVFVNGSSTNVIANNFIDMGTSSATALDIGLGCFVVNNVFKHNHASAIGVDFSSYTNHITNNSFYNAASGTNAAIYASSANGSQLAVITNNIIEGWDGTGGYAIEFYPAAQWAGVVAGNRYFDCNDPAFTYSTGDPPLIEEDNSALAASAFTDPANDDFTVTSEVAGAAWGEFKGASTETYLDTGAAQRRGALPRGLLG